MTHFFVHRPGALNETIAAIATPLGMGGVAIVRVSGKSARQIVSKHFSGPLMEYKTHTAHLGDFFTNQSTLIDTVLLLYMAEGRSYTGEETVELQCHGGSLIAQHIVDALLRSGARLAEPGEFTLRAFLNGRLDLAQAEAVQDLISAKSHAALQVAQTQLQGALSAQIRALQERLTSIAAILEAWVDFPEEGLEFASHEEITGDLNEISHTMQRLADSFYSGQIQKEGVRLCLIGAPNVGKSSLMNALLKTERAIVTPIAGTTRDLIEENLRIGGYHFSLTDTAGVHETEEIVEKEGIARSKKAMQTADIVLFVLDATRPQESLAPELIAQLDPAKTIVIWNKADLQHQSLICDELASFSSIISLSAKTTDGIEELQQEICVRLQDHMMADRSEIVVTQQRHHEAILEALTAVDSVKSGLAAGISPEFISSDMRHALSALGRIIGTNIGDDILGAIFSKFCVGK